MLRILILNLSLHRNRVETSGLPLRKKPIVTAKRWRKAKEAVSVTCLATLTFGRHKAIVLWHSHSLRWVRFSGVGPNRIKRTFCLLNDGRGQFHALNQPRGWRVDQHSDQTVLIEAGEACSKYHNKPVRNVKTARVDCDEIQLGLLV